MVIHNPEAFDCENCYHRQCATGKPLKYRGFDFPPTHTDWDFRICPKPHVVADTDAMYFYTMFKAWKTGICPDVGGFRDQLQINIEAINLIDSFITEHENDLMKERHRKAMQKIK